MKELDLIIDELKNTRKIKEIKISDEIIFDNAVKIFISDRINNSKFPMQVYKKNIEENKLKNEQEPNSKPSEKQIKLLNKFKISIPNTRKEASKLINKYIEEHR